MPNARLRLFVADMTRLVEERGKTEAASLEPARTLLAALVATDDWLPALLLTVVNVAAA